MGMDMLNELKKQLLELKKQNAICISKNLFYFIMWCTIFSVSSKIGGFGFPYVLDKERKYRVESFDCSNVYGVSKHVRYLKKDKLKKYDDSENIITLKSKYEIDEDGNYYRKIIVYSFDDAIDEYEKILDNYEEYSILENKIDEYIEYASEINDLWFDNVEVIVSYDVFDYDKYIMCTEEKSTNIMVSVICTILVINFGGYYLSNINAGLMYTKYQQQDLKKRIKEEKEKSYLR